MNERPPVTHDMAPALGEAQMYRVGAAYEAARDADDRDDGAAPLIQRVPGLEVTA